MTFDMSQFLATFYEESFEGLDIMETELLALDVGEADLETINTIFRAAHSIKGGSGTFGLNDVANFTHVMETLLDEMRDGKREVTQNAVNILLESVDVLREMLSTLQAEEELDVESISTVKQKLDALLAGESIELTVAEEEYSEKEDLINTSSSTDISEGWIINFKPHIDMLQTGNDPVRMFRELDALGELNVVPDISLLPDFLLMEPENSSLSWNLTLKGNIEKSSVEEVFDWVEDECDLTITPIASSTDVSTAIKDDDGELNIDLLEQTFELIEPQGEKLVARFYEELFKRYPKVKGLFLNTTSEKQQSKLLAALKLVVSNLRNHDVLVNALTEMGERHKKYGVQPEHYDAVTSTLLDVMEEYLGDAWTAAIGKEWKSALELVSNVMMLAYSKNEETKKLVSGNSEHSDDIVTPGSTAESNTTENADTKLEVAKSKRKATTESSSIRVSIDKVDELINMVGELVITQSMLS
ncbi:MAG: Hpt domain-containing protein, partial [Gammaproteobacteria bacterium]|nr:Hpt domain-containing protein [Gammaproteobacteria bacterium]